MLIMKLTVAMVLGQLLLTVSESRPGSGGLAQDAGWKVGRPRWRSSRLALPQRPVNSFDFSTGQSRGVFRPTPSLSAQREVGQCVETDYLIRFRMILEASGK